MAALVAENFVVPLRLEHSQFILRPLRISDVIKDYDAVMTSIDRLRGIFGPQSSWPTQDLTLEQDMIDLGWHHKEFQLRRSFAYTVMTPDETLCLGCAYIYPSENKSYDAEAYCWVRTSHAALDTQLYQSFKNWLRDSWPFKKVGFPGRDPTWAQWQTNI